MKLNCNWFMAVNFQRNWMQTKGNGNIVTFDENNNIEGELFLIDCEDPYAKIKGSVSDDNCVQLSVISCDPGVPQFEVFGSIYLDDEAGCHDRVIVMTDGTTVLGINY